MFLETYLHSTAPVASEIAQSEGSSAGSSLLVIIAVVIGVILLFSLLGGSEQPVVVVVQRAPGAILGWTVIAIAVAIVFFVYIAPATGTS